MANVFEVMVNGNARQCVKLETRIIQHRGKDGKGSWNEHQYLDKNLKWKKLLYGKTVKEVPTTNCFIVVPTDKTHLEDVIRAKYPARWVDEIVSTEAVMGEASPLQYEAVAKHREPLEDL